MEILNINNEITLKFSDKLIDVSELQDFIDYLKFREITSKSKATDQDIETLSNEINQIWWDKNKNSYLK